MARDKKNKGKSGGGGKFDLPVIEIPSPKTEDISKTDKLIQNLPWELYKQPGAATIVNHWLIKLDEFQRLSFYQQASALEENQLLEFLKDLVVAENDPKRTELAAKRLRLAEGDVIARSLDKLKLCLQNLSEQNPPNQYIVFDVSGKQITEQEARKEKWQKTVTDFENWILADDDRKIWATKLFGPASASQASNDAINAIILPENRRLSYRRN